MLKNFLKACLTFRRYDSVHNVYFEYRRDGDVI